MSVLYTNFLLSHFSCTERLCDFFICLQVAGFGHGNDTLLHTERHTQGSVQKYSKDTQVFPDLCIS